MDSVLETTDTRKKPDMLVIVSLKIKQSAWRVDRALITL